MMTNANVFTASSSYVAGYTSSSVPTIILCQGKLRPRREVAEKCHLPIHCRVYSDFSKGRASNCPQRRRPCRDVNPQCPLGPVVAGFKGLRCGAGGPDRKAAGLQGRRRQTLPWLGSCCPSPRAGPLEAGEGG